MSKQLHIVSCALACVVTACAAPPPLPPATPIASVGSIAGKWLGTVFYHASASPGDMTVSRDGTWAGDAFGRHYQGTFTLVNGEAHWKSLTTGATGTWVLRMVKGVPVLDGHGSNGSSFEDKRAA